MVESLFGNESIERILFFLLRNETCYASQLKNLFDIALSPIQQALMRLERGGVLVSTLAGKTRIFRFNPRYLFRKDLCLFLEKIYATLPEEIKEKYYEKPERRRPRRTGKPL